MSKVQLNSPPPIDATRAPGASADAGNSATPPPVRQPRTAQGTLTGLSSISTNVTTRSDLASKILSVRGKRVAPQFDLKAGYRAAKQASPEARAGAEQALQTSVLNRTASLAERRKHLQAWGDVQEGRSSIKSADARSQRSQLSSRVARFFMTKDQKMQDQRNTPHDVAEYKTAHGNLRTMHDALVDEAGPDAEQLLDDLNTRFESILRKPRIAPELRLEVLKQVMMTGPEASRDLTALAGVNRETRGLTHSVLAHDASRDLAWQTSAKLLKRPNINEKYIAGVVDGHVHLSTENLFGSDVDKVLKYLVKPGSLENTRSLNLAMTWGALNAAGGSSRRLLSELIKRLPDATELESLKFDLVVGSNDDYFSRTISDIASQPNSKLHDLALHFEDISNFFLGQGIANSLKEAISSDSGPRTLRSLDLSDTPYTQTPQGIKYAQPLLQSISEGLSRPNSLQVLKLNANRAKDSINFVGDALLQPECRLEHLELLGNPGLSADDIFDLINSARQSPSQSLKKMILQGWIDPGSRDFINATIANCRAACPNLSIEIR